MIQKFKTGKNDLLKIWIVLIYFIKVNTVLELVQKYFICHTIPPVMLLSHIKMWILLIIDPETDFPVDKFSVRRESIW